MSKGRNLKWSYQEWDVVVSTNMIGKHASQVPNKCDGQTVYASLEPDWTNTCIQLAHKTNILTIAFKRASNISRDELPWSLVQLEYAHGSQTKETRGFEAWQRIETDKSIFQETKAYRQGVQFDSIIHILVFSSEIFDWTFSGGVYLSNHAYWCSRLIGHFTPSKASYCHHHHGLVV